MIQDIKEENDVSQKRVGVAYGIALIKNKKS